MLTRLKKFSLLIAVAGVLVTGAVSARPSIYSLLNGIAVGPDHNVGLAWFYGGPKIQIQTVTPQGAQISIGGLADTPGTADWQAGHLAVAPDNTAVMIFLNTSGQRIWIQHFHKFGSLVRLASISETHIPSTSWLLDTNIDAAGNVVFMTRDYSAADTGLITAYSSVNNFIGYIGAPAATGFYPMAIRNDGAYFIPGQANGVTNAQFISTRAQLLSMGSFAAPADWRISGATCTPNGHCQVYHTMPVSTANGWRTGLVISDVAPNGWVSQSGVFFGADWDVYGWGTNSHAFSAYPFAGGDGMLSVAWDNGDGTDPHLMTIDPNNWSIASWTAL